MRPNHCTGGMTPGTGPDSRVCRRESSSLLLGEADTPPPVACWPGGQVAVAESRVPTSGRTSLTAVAVSTVTRTVEPAPVAPVVPVAPVAPVGPVGPLGPTSPSPPVGPVGPTGPIWPGGP